MLDFTLITYQQLLDALTAAGYAFQSFEEFVGSPKPRTVVLRHDVDRAPRRALAFARLQAERKIRGSYYFRIAPESFDEEIIRSIAALGHEIGYHYEDVAVEGRKAKIKGREVGRSKVKGQRSQGEGEGREIEELLARALTRFEGNLARMREVADIKTICMHGSPLSRWDSRLLWRRYDYRDYGIIGEPYFDVDFGEVLYLTDTGRRWDGERFNVRDKAMSEVRRSKVEGLKTQDRESEVGRFHRFHTTFDIIAAAEAGRLPNRMMLTFHPQRWTDRPLPWLRELVWQNVKNVVKFGLNRWAMGMNGASPSAKAVEPTRPSAVE